MGVVSSILGLLFSGNRNVIKETAEVFMENVEGASIRESAMRSAALEEFGKEFTIARQGGFDRFIDGLNRIPRPLMAFGTIGLCVSAMINPIWFAARMQGIALVPEPLWWLMGAIVSFYFGARYQVKGQEFQRSIAATIAQAPVVTANLRQLEALKSLEAGAHTAQENSGLQLPYIVGPTPASGAGAKSGRDAKRDIAPDILGFSSENSALAAWRSADDE